MVSVSIIVPVYNTEKYLKTCLESLLNQTIDEIEIIAVNDGSTDNSKDILTFYSEKYPHKLQVINKSNGGQASARNMALTRCKGEYVGFLDSDDYILPQMLEKMYTKAVQESADYVACGYRDITFEDGKEVVLEHYVASKKVYNTRDLFFGALVSPFIHLYKREILEKSKVKFPEGVIYEDTAFYLNLVPYLKKIVTIEEPLAVRVRHSNSTTTTFKKDRVANIFPVIDNILNYYRKNNFYEEYVNEVEFFCVKILLCSSMQRISKINKLYDAISLTNRTVEYINQNFNNYRRNPYMKTDKVCIYMKYFNKITSKIYLVFFRCVNIFRRTYS